MLTRFIIFLNSLLLILIGVEVEAQQLRGQAFDKVTKLPIAHAFITDSKRSLSVVSDSMGIFSISDVSKYDMLKISSMGYQSISILPNDTLFQIVYLSEISISLQEVKVVKRKYKRIKMGARERSADGEFGEGINPKYEMALLVSNQIGREGNIQAISFYFTKGSSVKIPFRIHIYTNHNGVPGVEITPIDVTVNTYRSNAWNKFNVSKYLLNIPSNGCFVSMEWLNMRQNLVKNRIENKQNIIQKIGLTTEFSESISFTRSDSTQWYSTQKIFTLERGLVLPQLTIYNPMIRMEVLFEENGF